MTPQSRAYTYGIAAVFFWSTVASALKITLRATGPLQMLLFSSGVSALVLFGVLLARGRLRDARPASVRDLLRSAALGFLNPFLYYMILFKAYSLLPGQEAQPLNYTWAIALAILSVPLLGQRIPPLGFAAILISFAGVLVISTRGDPLSMRFTNPLGVSLALGSSVIWALFWIYNIRDKRDEVAKLFLNFAFGFAFTLAYAAGTGGIVAPGGAALAGSIYIGIFEMGLTFVVWLKALTLSRTTAQVSNLIFLSPFLSLVLLRFVAGETIYPSSAIGLALIVCGILLQRRASRVRTI